MTKTALSGIACGSAAEAFESSWWFEPFGHDPASIAASILPRAVAEGRIAVGCAAVRWMRPLELPSSEPDGALLTWPGDRCGLAALVVKHDGRAALTAAWPFVTDGVEHEIAIERVLIAPDRLQAMIEGMVGGMPLTWLDVLFAVDRGFYAEGSVHRVVLAGIAHRFSIGSLPPVRITPDAPSYAALRGFAPQSVDKDGAILIRTEGMAAMVPIENSQPNVYSISGPVRKVSRYTGELFGAEVWEVRVTVARLGDDHDRNFDLSILVSDRVLGGSSLPKPGDDVSAAIRLQGRIWWPNVGSHGGRR